MALSQDLLMFTLCGDGRKRQKLQKLFILKSRSIQGQRWIFRETLSIISTYFPLNFFLTVRSTIITLYMISFLGYSMHYMLLTNLNIAITKMIDKDKPLQSSTNITTTFNIINETDLRVSTVQFTEICFLSTYLCIYLCW